MTIDASVLTREVTVDRRLEWRVFSPRQRRVRLVLLVVILVLFASTFAFDMSGIVRVAWALLVVNSMWMVVTGRAGTVADVDGVEVCGGIRTRRIPWTHVDEVRAVRSEWADPKVQIHLTDGSTQALPYVGTADVPQLEELQASARE